MAFQPSAFNRRREQPTRNVLHTNANHVRPGVLELGNGRRGFLHGLPCFSNDLPENQLSRHHQYQQEQLLRRERDIQQLWQNQPLVHQLPPERPQQLDRSQLGRRRQRLSYSRWNMMISSRYKTELCRQFQEDGDCPFEDKCLFAHGQDEIRPLARHPKYKTELCRDFHQVGFCSFGPRCNFIHSSTDVATLSARLIQKSRSTTPDSGIESSEDQSRSATATPTLDQRTDDTFYHFTENLYRELTGDSEDLCVEVPNQVEVPNVAKMSE